MGMAAVLLQLAGAAVMNVGLALMVAAAMSVWAGHHTTDRQQGTALLRAAAVLTLVGSVLLLWWQVAEMTELPLGQAWKGLGSVLLGSRIGLVWQFGAGALVVVLAVAVPAAGPGSRFAWRALALLAVGGFAASRSALGHAAAGAFGTLWLVDWVHLLAVSLWSGEVLLALRWCGWPDRGSASSLPARNIAAAVLRLSNIAAVALAGVLSTGAWLGWHALTGAPGAPGGLLDSTYGRVLTFKLVLVALAVSLGAFNRLVVLPQLLPLLMASPADAVPVRPPMRRLAAVLRVEALVLLMVLFAAAVLATRVPPS